MEATDLPHAKASVLETLFLVNFLNEVLLCFEKIIIRIHQSLQHAICIKAPYS